METLKNFKDKVSSVEMYYTSGEFGEGCFPLKMKDSDIEDLEKFLLSVTDCKAKNFEETFGIPEEEIEENAIFLGSWDVISQGLNFPATELVITEYKHEKHGFFYSLDITVVTEEDNGHNWFLWKKTENDIENCENWDFSNAFIGRVECEVDFEDGSSLSFDGEDQGTYRFKLNECHEPDADTIANEVLESANLGINDCWDDIIDHWA